MSQMPYQEWSNYIWYEQHAFYVSTEPADKRDSVNKILTFTEELGYIFKNDPTFDYIFNMPKSYFIKITELRRKRLSEQPPNPLLQ